ncbi:MAG TPA: NAD(P)H-dependent glycerol-3-phosphate dehydrogenase [bacterium]|nr:NAD(P)H-dependent glycerol-3-phosphate dehydrogenase [bacterium]
MKRIAVLGAGSWGTTLAILLTKKGHGVSLWEYLKEQAERLDRERENRHFLPGVPIPKEIFISSNLKEIIKRKEIILIVVPSQVLREVVEKLSKIKISPKTILVSATKGLEVGTNLRMSQIIKSYFPKNRIVVVSGPSHAEEVSIKIPATIVATASSEKLSREIQEVFTTPYFRVYTNPDTVGVELGGALKNIIAIASGICDGLGLGDSSKAALMTRGIVEIARLGVAMGAKQETFAGLSGIGDLITTCISRHSRNRGLGERIAKGRKLEEAQKEIGMVTEGVPTTKSAYELAKKYKVEMPITGELYNILFKGKNPKDAEFELMTRKTKREDR